MQEEIMLRQAAAISEKYELLRKETGSYFNIFEIADIATKEVKICRVIYELLSPLGCHYQGSVYLKLFMETVLGIENVDEDELHSAKVFRERIIDEKRRIDLLIETNKRIVPIEVKIYAEEQKNQCIDYFKFVNEKHKNARQSLYYLTRFGTAPTENSAKGLSCSNDKAGDSDIVCVSFAKDILQWLERCVKETETWKLAPIRETIVQLMLTIRRFTNQMDDREKKELIDLLRTSGAFMHGADKIKGAIDEAKKALMMDLFDTIDKKVKNEIKSLKKYKGTRYYKNRVKCYYDQKATTNPNLAYYYKKTNDLDVDICVSLEIDHKVFVGYRNSIKGEFADKKLVDDSLISELKNKIVFDGGGDANSDWLAWKYITLVYPESPDFKNHNEAFYALFDKKYFDEYAEECAKAIVEMLKE